MTLCESYQLRHFLRAAHYKSFSIVILVCYIITEQNSIDIIVKNENEINAVQNERSCLLYTSPSPRDRTRSRMPSSA